MGRILADVAGADILCLMAMRMFSDQQNNDNEPICKSVTTQLSRVQSITPC